MSAVDQARAEVAASLAEIAPAHEGFRDYADLNRGQPGGLLPATQEEVSKIILEYDQRRDLLTTALAALDALIADGHPVVPDVTIPEAAYKDLQANFETVQAALGKVKPIAQAATLGLTGSPPEPK